MEPTTVVPGTPGLTFESRKNEDGTSTWVWHVPDADPQEAGDGEVAEQAQVGFLRDIAETKAGDFPIGIAAIGGGEALLGTEVARGLATAVSQNLPTGGIGANLGANQITAAADLLLAFAFNTRTNRDLVGRDAANFATTFMVLDGLRLILPIDNAVAQILGFLPGLGTPTPTPDTMTTEQRNRQHRAGQTPDIVKGRLTLLKV